MKTIKQMLITVAVLLCSVAVNAYDFEVDGIYYNILSARDLTVEVTKGDNKYSGEVIIPSTISYNSKTLTVTSIGKYAFYNCKGLTSVTIPNSVTRIEMHAFYDCNGLTSITIGNGVTSIGEYAFYDCNSLTSITIPNSVTSIRNSAFRNCSGLTSITIPNSVTSIGDCAFESCNGLTSIVVETGNSVYDSRNNCNAIIKTETNKLVVGCKNTIIPNSVTSIEWNAFLGCSGLTNVTIPNSVKGIGEGVFYGCSGLTNVTIPDSVKGIGNYAFSYCTGLTSVTIPNSVTTIGGYAFSYCKGLTSVTIGNSVTTIGNKAFKSCDALTSIYLLGKTPAIMQTSFTFDNSCYKNATLYVPQGSLDAYKAATGWKEFANVVEFDPTGIEDVTEEATPAFEITAGGILFTAAEGKAIAIYAANGALVEKIDNYAGEEITLDKGVYILCVGNKTMKVKL